jgi:MoxR-like ATPase
LIDEDIVRNIVGNLIAGKHILLAGPIGTGKTHLATLISKYVWSEVGGYYPEVFTAASTWTTQDVIGGIYPKIDDEKIIYEIQKGCVSDTVSRNWRPDEIQKKRCNYVDGNGNSFRGVWLVIDEFNRANIDASFGEMITAMEYGKLKIPTNKKGENYEELLIPKDYRIIATLNTFDKHFLFKLSDALKRRFAYIEILPPSIKNIDEEKYYVLKRGYEDFRHIPNIQDKISLIETEDKYEINRDETDPYILYLLDSAFDMFRFIRQTKNLGTAILISIFRYIIIDSVLNNEPNIISNEYDDNDRKLEKLKLLESSLDNAFHSNIIPQLEGKPKWTLESIGAFCCENITDLFKKQNIGHIDFSRYAQEFEKLILFLRRDNLELKLENFRKGQISEEEWSNYDPWKGKQRPKLPKFKRALKDLIGESELM